jgi:predicted phosphodiesterase
VILSKKTITKIAVISDPQIDLRKQNNIVGKKDYEILQECLKYYDVDAWAICGDITENGSLDEWNCFFDIFKSICPTKELFFVHGNMDRVYKPEGKDIFVKVYKRFGGNNEKLYFSHETDNCFYFGIVHEPINNGEISDTQLLSLDKTIQKAAKLGLPTIIFSHYLVDNTIENKWKLAFLGEYSTRIVEILEKYNGKVIFFSGHIHRGFILESGGSVITKNNVTYISTPSLCYPDTEHYQADNESIGTGYIVELLDKEIHIRGFDFMNREWLASFDWSV